MQLAQIFTNDVGRLRSGWRFGVFLLLFAATLIAFNALARSISAFLPGELGNSDSFARLTGGLMSLAAAIFSGWFCGKYLENLPFRALGAWFTQNWLKDLGLGFAAGGLAVTLAVLIAVLFGGLRFHLNRESGSEAIFATLGLSFLVFLVAAAFEEALFRGYILQTFERAGLAWFAIALTSLFFGLVHLGNPAANLISTTNTIIAGILFSVAYLKTRTLWFVFGLHFIWNWMQGAFFGIEVSGLRGITTSPLLREIDRGPAWLTGQDYGIEGGIACTISLLVFIFLILCLPILKATEEMKALTGRENPKEVLTSGGAKPLGEIAS